MGQLVVTTASLTAMPADALTVRSAPPLVEQVDAVPAGEAALTARVASTAQPAMTLSLGAEVSGVRGVIPVEAHQREGLVPLGAVLGLPQDVVSPNGGRGA